MVIVSWIAVLESVVDGEPGFGFVQVSLLG